LIERAEQNTGLPASLIASVILQESGGNPSVISSSGAVGLMQVMPCDGIASEFMCVNGPCFASRPNIVELQDPEFNIAYGSQMLADLSAKHGSYREALYKYGPIDMGYRYADIVLKIWSDHQ
jgi:soluble lytic murein transglycosylase-like protein